MSNVDQLLSKAMSTSSEEEAMSCLRMARKKGTSYEGSTPASSTYNGHTAEHWYDKAAKYYADAKAKQDYSVRVYKAYQEMCDKYTESLRQIIALKRNVSELQKKNSKPKWYHFVMVFQAVLILLLVASNGVHSTNDVVVSTISAKGNQNVVESVP